MSDKDPYEGVPVIQCEPRTINEIVKKKYNFNFPVSPRGRAFKKRKTNDKQISED